MRRASTLTVLTADSSARPCASSSRRDEKRKAGGKRNHCPDCAEETTVPYLAVKSANGKMSDLTILAFDSQQDRDRYQRAWKNNTGHNKGKSCHLSGSNTVMSGLKFRQVCENRANANHKGKS